MKGISDVFENQPRIFGIRTDLIERLDLVLRKDRKAQVGATIVIALGLAAIFAPELAPYDPMAQQFRPLEPPFVGDNLLGTDSYGRDMLSRLMFGARVSLLVGLGAVSVGMVLGVLVGLFAGFYGGWVDDVLMRIIDTMWAFPYILVAIIYVAIFGPSITNVIVAVGFGLVDDFARITRGEVLSLREEEFTLAAEAIGLGNLEIIFGEIFPNTVGPIIVQFTIYAARAMIIEATLSFLGLGVNPTTPTWGMLLGQGRSYIGTAWWISILPGLFIVIAVLGINLFGDALRDAFDVKDVGGV